MPAAQPPVPSSHSAGRRRPVRNARPFATQASDARKHAAIAPAASGTPSPAAIAASKNETAPQ